MTHLNIIVEGHAEETFVREVLSPHFAALGKVVNQRRAEVSRDTEKIHRGGILNYSKFRQDIVNWLNQEKQAVVTTMADLYKFRLPKDISKRPAWEEARQKADPYQKVDALERLLAEDINSPRFIPYIQLHEFEALIFSDLTSLASYYPVQKSGINQLAVDVSHLPNPEWINEGEDTAPSKRILSVVPAYDKATAGAVIALDLGLANLRTKCPHFNKWITCLESLP